MKMTREVSDLLKSYVYVYTDPRTKRPFYIGKGRGNRLFAHLNDTSETKTVDRIAAIRKSGKEPQIDLLCYGLTDGGAALVEAAAIDLIGLSHLTNRIAGHHKGSYRRIGASEVIDMLRAKPVQVRHKAILIRINQLYRSNMTAKELYEATRGIWVVSKRRRAWAEYGIAVYQGIVREVYKIQEWYPAGTLEYYTRDTERFESSDRWEFKGVVATDIRNKYVGHSVASYFGKGARNPIRYTDA